MYVKLVEALCVEHGIDLIRVSTLFCVESAREKIIYITLMMIDKKLFKMKQNRLSRKIILLPRVVWDSIDHSSGTANVYKLDSYSAMQQSRVLWHCGLLSFRTIKLASRNISTVLDEFHKLTIKNVFLYVEVEILGIRSYSGKF